MDSTHVAESTPSPVTYQDCILGKVGTPAERKQKTILQVMMMVSSIPITVTVNWVINTPDLSWEAFSGYLYMYPMMLAIVASVRFLIANPITERIIRKFISPNLSGLKKALAISALNICIMGTIVAAIRTLIVNGGLQGLSPEIFAGSLPVSFIISFCSSYFLVSPLAKKVFAKQIEPRMVPRPAPHGTAGQGSTDRRLNFKKPVKVIKSTLSRRAAAA